MMFQSRERRVAVSCVQSKMKKMSKVTGSAEARSKILLHKTKKGIKNICQISRRTEITQQERGARRYFEVDSYTAKYPKGIVEKMKTVISMEN